MRVRPAIGEVRGQSLSGAGGKSVRSGGGKVRGNRDAGKNGGARKKDGRTWTEERKAAARERIAAGKPGTKPGTAELEPDPAPVSTANAEPTNYEPGFFDGEWQDSGVRGRVFIVGLPNSGKSYLLVERCRRCRRIVVYDPVNADTLKALIGDGFVQVHQPGELRDALANAWGGEFRILYTPTQGVEALHFEAVNELVRKCGSMVYAIDEVDKNQQPAYAPPQFYELLNYGRHHQIAMIGTARRPAQVSKEYTYGLSEVCAFTFTEPGDLKYFESKCGAEATKNLPSLDKYAYIRWQQDGRLSKGKGWDG